MISAQDIFLFGRNLVSPEDAFSAFCKRCSEDPQMQGVVDPVEIEQAFLDNMDACEPEWDIELRDFVPPDAMSSFKAASELVWGRLSEIEKLA